MFELMKNFNKNFSAIVNYRIYNIKLKDTKKKDGVASLIREVFPNADVSIEQDDRFLIAENSGTPIGFAHLKEKKKMIMLQCLGVLSAFRNGGVGSALLAETLKICEKKNKPIFLKVKAINITAISLYEKYGFSVKKTGDTLILEKKRYN